MKKITLIVNNDFKKREKQKFFVKQELKCILNLYAKMVSNGSWKDYSFSSGNKEISFDVYQRASEKPFIRITKNFKPNFYNEKYFIKDSNGNIIKKSENLKSDAISCVATLHLITMLDPKIHQKLSTFCYISVIGY